jgi:hypothetical protein
VIGKDRHTVERPTRSVHRESCRPQGRPRSLKCWYRSEMSLFRSPRVVTCTEGNTRSSVNGEDVKDRRSSQAVACMKRCRQELGRPIQLLGNIGYGDNEARRGNPDTGLGANLSDCLSGRGTEADVEGPWLCGSRIKHSNRRWGKPTTW